MSLFIGHSILNTYEYLEASLQALQIITYHAKWCMSLGPSDHQ